MQKKYKDNNEILKNLEELSLTYMLFDDSFYNGFVYAVNYFISNKVNFAELSETEIQLLEDNSKDICVNDNISYSIEFLDGIKGAYEAAHEICYSSIRTNIFL